MGKPTKEQHHMNVLKEGLEVIVKLRSGEKKGTYMHSVDLGSGKGRGVWLKVKVNGQIRSARFSQVTAA